jgi:hypothetical protein
LKGIQWWAEKDFGTTELNRGYVGKIQIRLDCQAAARPSWFSVEVEDFGGSAAWVRFDSNTGATYQREYWRSETLGQLNEVPIRADQRGKL